MDILADRGKSTGKQCFVPGQRTIHTVGNCPATIDCHIPIAELVQLKVDKGLGVGFDDCLVGGARVMVVRVPAGSC